jgi:REP element-mobilizing transposase RayT
MMNQVHPSKYYPDRKNIRLKDFCYATHGSYFVTIVTQNRKLLFGYIKDGENILNEAGQMVTNVYEEMNQTYPLAYFLNAVVMPNHFHCLICLQEDDAISLSRIIQHFKSETTWRYSLGVKEKGWPRYEGKLWQGRFYDHIVRSQPAYDMINQYIYNNPMRWDKDKLNPSCINDADDINAMIKQYETSPIIISSP